MRSLLNFLIDLIANILNIIKGLLARIFEKFIEINIFEKGIVLSTFLAFLAEVLPMAKYFIFESYRTIANPDAHYMIYIVLMMLITIYLPGTFTTILRVGANGLYLLDIIYLWISHGISKAPYEIASGYYLNIIVPILFIFFSTMSFFFYKEY